MKQRQDRDRQTVTETVTETETNRQTDRQRRGVVGLDGRGGGGN